MANLNFDDDQRDDINDDEDDSSDDSPSPIEVPEAASSPESAQAAPAAPLNPMLQSYLKSRMELQAAQQQAKQNQLGTGLTAALVQLGHGISRAPGETNLDAVKELAKNDEAPVKEFLQRKAASQEAFQEEKNLEDNDPESDTAKRLRQIYTPMFIKAGLNPNSLDGLNARQIREYAQNPLEFTMKQKTLEASKQATNQARLEAAQERAAAAQEKAQKAAYEKVDKSLQSLRGDPEAINAAKNMGFIKNAKDLIDAYPNPDTMPPQQVTLLMSELGKISSGGVAGEATLHELEPNTGAMWLASKKNQLFNGTSGANAGAFINEAKKYLKGLDKTNAGIINERNGRILNANKHLLGDEGYRTLQESYNHKRAFSDDDESKAAAPHGGKYPPGSTLKVKGKLYKVGADGDSLIPAYAEGGAVKSDSDDSPKIDPKKAKEMEAGANESGWQPEQWKKNLKEGLHFSEGGVVPGKAPFKGNDHKNDIVPIVASSGEFIIPNNIMESNDPGEEAKKFINRYLGKE